MPIGWIQRSNRNSTHSKPKKALALLVRLLFCYERILFFAFDHGAITNAYDVARDAEREASASARAAARAARAARASSTDDDDDNDRVAEDADDEDEDDLDDDDEEDELSSGEKDLLGKIREKKKLQALERHRKSSVRNQQAVLPRKSGLHTAGGTQVCRSMSLLLFAFR